MPKLKEQRAGLMESLRELVESAKAADRVMTAEEQADFDAKTAEIEQIDATIARQEKGDAMFAEVAETGKPQLKVDQSVKAGSLGEHFVKSMRDAGRTLKSQGGFAAPQFKAATDTTVVGDGYKPLLTDVDSEFVTPYRRQLVVADLLGSGTVSGNAITYPVFAALEGEPAFINEGAFKPQVHLGAPTWQTDALSEVAAHIKITDDMAEDLPYVVSEINTTLQYALAFVEETALLSGNGTTPNLRGLLNRSGIQTLPKGKDTDPDRIFQAICDVQEQSGLSADGIVINPADYSAIRLLKDGNNQYMGGGFFTGQYGNGEINPKPPLWGLRTLVTSSIEKGTVLVGAFATGAKVFRKGGLRVESTNSHDKDFTSDLITIRARERLGLQVKFPAAFCKVTLGQSA